MGSARGADLVALDDAMEELARLDPRKVQVVEMRFFGVLSVEETAEVLKVSPVTVSKRRSVLPSLLMLQPPTVTLLGDDLAVAEGRSL